MTDVLSREQIEEARQALLIATNNNPCANTLCDLALRGLDDAEDAERYRWLRESQSIPADILLNHHDALDAAIDAARKERA